MPRSLLDPPRLQWWRDNRKRIDRLKPRLRRNIRQILEKEIEKAQQFMWDEILRIEGLSMNQGIVRLVYIGRDFDLDAIWSGAATIETEDGHYASVKFVGMRSVDK